MQIEQPRKTAKIYKFPLRGRLAVKSGISEEDLARVRNYIDCGSWYHQEAIEEEQKKPSDGPKLLS